MNGRQMSIAEQVQAQEYRGRRTFLVAAWVFGLATAVLLAYGDRAGALRWLAQHGILMGLVTVVILRRWLMGAQGWMLPLAMTLTLAPIPIWVAGGFDPLLVYMAALVMSAATRDRRAPLPALGIVVLSAAWSAWNGRLGTDNLVFNGGMLVIVGLILHLITSRCVAAASGQLE
jgi:hypothetical protein